MNKPKYDVFISSKSEDYPIAREVYSFLKGKGYNVFFAEKSIPFGADSVFKKTIDSALDSAKNMILISTNPASLNEGWVYYEWNTFSTEILNSNKPNSNIVTILDQSIAINDIPIGLRSFQRLSIRSYKETICAFLDDRDLKPDPIPPLIPDENKILNILKKKWKCLLWVVLVVLLVIIIATLCVKDYKNRKSLEELNVETIVEDPIISDAQILIDIANTGNIGECIQALDEFYAKYPFRYDEVSYEVFGMLTVVGLRLGEMQILSDSVIPEKYLEELIEVTMKADLYILLRYANEGNIQEFSMMARLIDKRLPPKEKWSDDCRELYDEAMEIVYKQASFRERNYLDDILGK